MPELAIKMNNTAADSHCSVCGGRVSPLVGPALFRADGWGLVCELCGWRYAPALARMLEEYSDRQRLGAVLVGEDVPF